MIGKLDALLGLVVIWGQEGLRRFPLCQQVRHVLGHVIGGGDEAGCGRRQNDVGLIGFKGAAMKSIAGGTIKIVGLIEGRVRHAQDVEELLFCIEFEWLAGCPFNGVTGEGGVMETSSSQAAGSFEFDPESCAMYMPEINTFQTMSFGTDYDVFLLPPQTDKPAAAVMGRGIFLPTFRDRPEVRALLAHLASTDFDPAPFAPPRLGSSPSHPEAHRRYEVALLAESIAAGTFRFDGSDLMPGAIGSAGQGAMRDFHPGYIFELGTPGSFYHGIAELHAGTHDDPAQILYLIEQDWLAYEEWAEAQPGG